MKKEVLTMNNKLKGRSIIGKLVILLALMSVVFLGCQNPFNRADDVKEGYGRVIFTLGGAFGSARTAYPSIPAGMTYTWGNWSPATPTDAYGAEITSFDFNAPIELPVGTYSVTITGTYGGTKIAETVQSFTISATSLPETVRVYLEPVIGGNGILNLNITYSDADEIDVDVTLWKLASSGDVDVEFATLIKDTMTAGAITGSTPSVPAGMYLAKLEARSRIDSDDVLYGRLDAVHIYQNLTTNYVVPLPTGNALRQRKIGGLLTLATPVPGTLIPSIVEGDGFEENISWTRNGSPVTPGAGVNFQPNSNYVATIGLNLAPGFTTFGMAQADFNITGTASQIEFLSPHPVSGLPTIIVTFAPTVPLITVAPIDLPAPSVNGVPATSTDGTGYTGTVVWHTWTGADVNSATVVETPLFTGPNFLGSGQYAARITLVADAAHTTYTLPANAGFSIDNVSTAVVTNTLGTASGVVVTAIFEPLGAASVTAITINQNVTNLSYAHGATLNFSGLQFTVDYSDNTSEGPVSYYTGIDLSQYQVTIYIDNAPRTQNASYSLHNGKDITVRGGGITSASAGTLSVTAATATIQSVTMTTPKVYDGTTATDAGALTLVFSGVSAAELTATATGYFATDAAGETSLASIGNIVMSGTLVDDYAAPTNLTGHSTTAIAQRPITITTLSQSGLDKNDYTNDFDDVASNAATPPTVSVTSSLAPALIGSAEVTAGTLSVNWNGQDPTDGNIIGTIELDGTTVTIEDGGTDVTGNYAITVANTGTATTTP